MKSDKIKFLAITLLMISLVFPSIILAQNTPKAQLREVGVRTPGWGNMGLIYKRQGVDKKSIRRFTLTAITGAANFGNDDAVNVSLQIGIGSEKRNAISEKLAFMRGFQWAIALGLRSNRYTGDSYATPSVGYLLGLRYQAKNNWSFGIESVPTLYVQIGQDIRNEFAVMPYMNFDISNVSLFVTYGF